MAEEPKSDLEKYYDMMKALAPNRAEREEVERLRDKATSYVCGWEDAGGEKIENAEWLFGLAYGIHAAEFTLGKRASRSPIQDAWVQWRERGMIGNH